MELAQLQAEVSRMQFAMALASQAPVFGMGNPSPATSAPVTYPNHAGQIAQIKAQLACLAQQLDQLAPGEQGRVPTGV